MKHQDEFNDQIRSIFVDGKIRPINWGAESETQGWVTWSVEEKLAYAMELASAMNQAADMMQKERNELLEKTKFAEEQLANCEKNLEIQKSSLYAAITNHNERTQEDARTIQDLEARIKAQDVLIEKLNKQLDGNHHQLGD